MAMTALAAGRLRFQEKNAQLNNSTLDKFTLEVAAVPGGEGIGNPFVTKALSKSSHCLYSVNLSHVWFTTERCGAQV